MVGILLYLIFFFIVFIKTRKNLFAFIFLLLATSPSIKLLGLDNESFLNLNINNYLLYFVLPLFLSYKFFTNKKFQKKVHELGIYIRPWIIGIIIFILASAIYCIYYSLNFFNTPYYFILTYWCAIWSFYFVIYCSTFISTTELWKDFFFIFSVTFFYSVIIALLQRFGSPFFNDLVNNLYNFQARNENVSMQEYLQSINFQRTISIFSWVNQFGSFLALSMITFLVFYTERYLDLKKIIAIFFVGLLGLVLTASRASIILLFIGIFLVFNRIKKKKIIVMAFLILFIVPYLIYLFNILPDPRIAATSSVSHFSTILENDRGFYWQQSIDFAMSIKYSWLFGFYQHYIDTFKVNIIESGIITPLVNAGIPMILNYLWVITTFYFVGRKIYKNTAEPLGKVMGRVLMIWSPLFFIGEISQSWFQVYRIGVIVITFYTLSIVISEKTESLEEHQFS